VQHLAKLRRETGLRKRDCNPVQYPATHEL
jgi:hypothetical protein